MVVGLLPHEEDLEAGALVADMILLSHGFLASLGPEIVDEDVSFITPS